ncbi:hypothetical protein JCM14202_3535 [Agrilactobacillus composti DSM 18527 = JCM 14202]|uniref:zinc ribbon domain-containing protein n=1 Tax=Agrilactobacillus composti TaxID=398555 RepID=UPI00042E01F1|nr:zinc ribbon domain-containing protein [Agrilactobacillus composti]GAF41585.1 hypothetical protein JCM14202_3535 [Agrilactobacillus composti DSM 18527 = JCM 14202]
MPKCGTKRIAGSKFCQKCGYQFKDPLPAQPPRKQQQVDHNQGPKTKADDVNTTGIKIVFGIIGVIVVLLFIVAGVYHNQQSQATDTTTTQNSTNDDSSSDSDNRFYKSAKKNADVVIDDIDDVDGLADAMADPDSSDTHAYHVIYDDEGLTVKFSGESDMFSEVVGRNYEDHWNELVDILKQDSAEIEDAGGASHILIKNPNNSDRRLLEINAGKIEYNVATDN